MLYYLRRGFSTLVLLVSILLTLGAHAQRGLRYLVCPSVCVCVCVCLSVYLNPRTTGNEVACERYTRLQGSKRSKNNVADLAKTAAFWPEKSAMLWTKFRDPTHQLARCACISITHLGACSTGSAAGGSNTLPGDLHCAASLLQNRCISFQGM